MSALLWHSSSCFFAPVLPPCLHEAASMRAFYFQILGQVYQHVYSLSVKLGESWGKHTPSTNPTTKHKQVIDHRKLPRSPEVTSATGSCLGHQKLPWPPEVASSTGSYLVHQKLPWAFSLTCRQPATIFTSAIVSLQLHFSCIYTSHFSTIKSVLLVFPLK